ncbi:MAG TPA: hypothetical protein VD908_20610 [Cytophagales bacterium]|nr:hypothetical protein [Cytophagales bacterium]
MIDELKRLFMLEEIRRRYLKLADNNKELYENLIPLNQDFLQFYESVKKFAASLEDSFRELKVKQRVLGQYNISTRDMEIELQNVGELNLKFVKELGIFIETNLYLPTRVSNFIKEIHRQKSLVEEPPSIKECDRVLGNLEKQLEVLFRDFLIYKTHMLKLKAEFKALQLLHNKSLN